MTDDRPPLAHYSPARSIVKGVKTAAGSALTSFLGFLVILDADPELAERLRAFAAGHPKSLVLVGLLIAGARAYGNYRKQTR